MDSNIQNLKPRNTRLIFSLLGIIYVWSLPLLADIGFAQKNATSISGFIANPPATGGMAFISFSPLVLMWEYQDYVIKRNQERFELCYWSLALFQLFYGIFLICTLGYVPEWLHVTSVSLFGCCMIIHYFLILTFMKIMRITQIILLIGIISFAGLLFVDNMWIWGLECVSFTCMLLFTVLEWVYLKPRGTLGDSVELSSEINPLE